MMASPGLGRMRYWSLGKAWLPASPRMMKKEPCVVLASDLWVSLPTAFSSLILVTLRSQLWLLHSEGLNQETGLLLGPGRLTDYQVWIIFSHCSCPLRSTLVIWNFPQGRLGYRKQAKQSGRFIATPSQGLVKLVSHLLRKHKEVHRPHGRSLHSATSQSLLKTSRRNNNL